VLKSAVLKHECCGIIIDNLHLLMIMLLKSTTRHIHVFAAEVVNNELVPNDGVLTIDVDPDNELIWNDGALQQVYRRFEDLVAASQGQDLTDYNIRRIGSDLEHLIRSLLQSGQVSYNLNSRVRNYSLGLPQVVNTEQNGG
jgi:NAD(P)H-quinone oxidoreductase subunit M